ncbi:hypothetical protein PFAG_02822 [Plasmodium falciparum Santa Lucia]|uniref:CWC16 domain-containing protein, putative n=14 Tax=Plasmodium falciparum TaxID=5833 RepID=Q8IJP4_PLAF7|nr:uncharacterized protein PF3D7_1015100 [Plasmodium falciparum 3D7]ETW18318.1 hypothetical protein PFFVO_02834 [Plasmodium falciparum Vietnam Oak-Knoll (FVO)]ETW30733.1 hypothetical protein PFFCH_01850 [Plasmodium falciparum FCH/4]ETW36403.1 hypothetical protein PFTANZ_02892 [Plasmodium falciparum Tanzania (2000708)]ETW42719.1 hypothetical protein PFNF135_02991 [Plasmodium falciparum NF135/5.C10]ETW49135.1 hypothetical protein PFMALIP_02837 [Plasmodium falciparum MaliPS096_E11]ETW56567.1 hyp|eukprot:XP_001347433.1 uncharacterized protein PF3D7_1015100 [Plasmodium falciparum 3D7]
MAERKVLNKYIPPDFDPDKLMESKKLLKKIEKRKNRNQNKTKKKLMNIRMMYPFTLKCNKCKTFTYVGTKFNSRVEKLKDETYLNIPIWKFYGKCQECKNEIIFKTDPKNGDYLLIAGGTRTYDAHKEQELADDYYRNSNVKDEDKIKNTEKQSYNAMLELKMNEQLEELQNMNKRHLDKFSSINKALNRLYEKSELENKENNFFMNNLDSEDEKAFFSLLNKSRSSKDHIGDNLNKYNPSNNNWVNKNIEKDNIIIEEVELDDNKNNNDEVNEYISEGEGEHSDGNNINEVNESFSDLLLKKKKNRYEKENTVKIKQGNIDTEDKPKDNQQDKTNNISFKNTISNNSSSFSNIIHKPMFNKINKETNFNFVIKKKENFQSLLSEYNSDNSNESDN